MPGHSDNPLSHVIDHDTLELPWLGEIDLPNLFGRFQITRFMVMEVVAATLVILIVVPLARHVARQPVTRGRFVNMFEAMIFFIRDAVARPAIDGGHTEHAHGHDDHGHAKPDAHEMGHEIAASGHLGEGPTAIPRHSSRSSDRFMPFLWTIFFFVLFCNLLGMIPGGASATGNINVTAPLAAMVLITVFIAGMTQMGVGGFFIGIVPKMDVPKILKPPLLGMMFVIELLGLFIKHFVLAVRLFANMLAGHIVLAVILGFAVTASGYLRFFVIPGSVFGGVAIGLLELFVAFLQAYVFTFLAALFIGTAVHPH